MNSIIDSKASNLSHLESSDNLQFVIEHMEEEIFDWNVLGILK